MRCGRPVKRGARRPARALNAAAQASGGGARYDALAARVLLLADDFGGAVRAIPRAETTSSPDEARLVLIARAFTSGMLGDFTAAISAFDHLVRTGAPLPCLLAALELSVNVE